MEDKIIIAINSLEKYIESGDYKGYDPYDTLLSFIPFKKLGNWPAVIATQIQKRNPVNIRPLLGIKKDYNPKAMGLFLQAYSLLYKKTNDRKYLEKAELILDWLISNYSPGYSGYCWGYNFPWASPVKYVDAFVPSSVVTGFVCKGIYEYWKITKDSKSAEVINSASDFILNDLPITETKDGICFSYTPVMKDVCYNSSLLAAETLCYNSIVNKKQQNNIQALKAVDYVIAKQLQDGKWNYSLDINTGKEREQIDFHQGFILESIYTIKSELNFKSETIDLSLKKGMEFYINNQFDKNGISLWRLPKKWPIDIHNQSQGIITFAKLSCYNDEFLNFALKIAEWTIANMQGPSGCFYYRINKTCTNRIPFMRWSQAWMFLALAVLISKTTQSDY
jgi:rhamnogalacturonyl hydrolase YesR